jgi:succinyl-diaminopimelate desuccinylase
MLDVISLASDLIRIPSVSPAQEEPSLFLASVLEKMGFHNHVLPYGDTVNLFSIKGQGGRHFSFAGHFDVVPAGDGWSHNPFDPQVKDGVLYGRGAVDMKGAIAAFVVALSMIDLNKIKGTISLLLSGNEEEDATNGTPRVLNWLKEQEIKIDDCLVGEPTNPSFVGDMAKIGRRGSINFHLDVKGVQGHVAYNEIAVNPITILVKILSDLQSLSLDDGNKNFPKSNLEVTNIAVDNKATNVIPGEAKASFNIRFNNIHNPISLEHMIDKICKRHTKNYTLKLGSSSESFLSNAPQLQKLVVDAVKKVTGIEPVLSTTGGTSDARFIHHHANIIEFGLVNESAHKIDEHISIEELQKLVLIYKEIILSYFHA